MSWFCNDNKGKENIKVKKKIMCWECSYHLVVRQWLALETNQFLGNFKIVIWN